MQMQISEDSIILIKGDEKIIEKAGQFDASTIDVSGFRLNADTLAKVYDKACYSSATELDENNNLIPCIPAQEYVVLKAKFIEQYALSTAANKERASNPAITGHVTK